MKKGEDRLTTNKVFVIVLISVLLIISLAVFFIVRHNKKSAQDDDAGTAIDSTTDDASIASQGDADKTISYQLDEFDEELIAYMCLNGYDDSDFVISPASFRASLCTAAIGAQGNTRTELLNVAGFSGMNALDTWYSDLDDSVVDSIWSNDEKLGKFSDAYVSNLTENYHADACSDDSDKFTHAINDWINVKTDGAISTVVDDVSGASSVMVSTLTFRAAWENTFSEAAINEGVFVGNNGVEQSMDYMEQTGEYLYAEEEGIRILVIPMENDMSFVCFVGNQADRWDKMTGFHPEKVHVVLPKFEFESAFDSRDIYGFLLQRGIDDAINRETANFYNMCSDADWFMQEIVHKVRIVTDEHGIAYSSETPAASGGRDSSDSGEIKEFIADGPFSFAVFSGFGTDSQYMLLYGQMVNGN